MGLFLFVLSVLIFTETVFADQHKMVVCVPVTDVRCEPNSVPMGAKGPALSQDIGGQVTQVLCGDVLLGEPVHSNSDWMRVEVLGQKIVPKKSTWSSCVGFVQTKNVCVIERYDRRNIVLRDLWSNLYSLPDKKHPVMCVAMGTMLHAKRFDKNWLKVSLASKTYYLERTSNFGAISVIEPDFDVMAHVPALRKNIVQSARKFIGTPYVLGGRSGFNNNLDGQITGIDCSKLVHIAYLAGAGFEVPCNSTSQKYVCKLLNKGTELQPADLIFFYDKKKKAVNHVAIYTGNNMLIESAVPTMQMVYCAQDILKQGIALKDCAVKEVSVKSRIGVGINKIKSGKTRALDGRIIYLGTLLDSDKKIRDMRLIALGCDVKL